MHFDDWGLASARLRSPAQIGVTRPLIITFSANEVVTAGHFWEVVLTPTDTVASAEVSSDMFPFGALCDFVAIGLRATSATPCTDGWAEQVVLRRHVKHVTDTYVGDPFATTPQHATAMTRYSLVVATDSIRLYRDADGDGTPEVLIAKFPYALVPWSEIYVHFLGTAWLAESYPDDATCGDYYNTERFIGWRALTINNVKYSRAAALPRQQGTTRTPLVMGWSSYDIRDLEHSGTVGGIDQPNEQPYDNLAAGIACVGTGPGNCAVQTSATTLSLSLTDSDLSGASTAILVYDIRGDGDIALTRLTSRETR